MRILVLGGTVFLSRAVAVEAVRRGHEVTCLARGASGGVPDDARLVVADRSAGLPDLGPVDAVVDVARQPSWVRAAVAALPDPHWVFVSTINVYADDATPGGGPSTLPLRAPREDDADLRTEPDAYGPMKVACEQLVLDGVASAMVIRPGLIVGPGDPTGRFSYWPRRLAAGGEVLAPGDPADSMQIIDVRDLAEWIVDSCEQRRTGVYDAIGPAQPLAALLDACAAGVAKGGVTTGVSFTWVDQEFLVAEGVQPWAGPDAVPLWLPRPEYAGLPTHDDAPSLAAGLRIRSVEKTAADTLAWLDAVPDAVVSGIGREREAELLAAYRARPR